MVFVGIEGYCSCTVDNIFSTVFGVEKALPDNETQSVGCEDPSQTESRRGSGRFLLAAFQNTLQHQPLSLSPALVPTDPLSCRQRSFV